MLPLTPTAWLLGAAAGWATGLYVLTRGGAQRIPLSAAAALGALALYMVGEAAADAPGWQRATWWVAVVGSAVWAGLVNRLAAEEAPTRLPTWTGEAALVVAVAAGAAGTAGTGVVDWSTGALGPLYPAFALLELLLVVVPIVVLDRARRAQPPGGSVRTRLLGLEVAGVLFGTGAGAAMAARAGSLPGVAAAALLAAGTLLMGWNVARYGALVSGQVLGPDAVAYAASIALILAVYGAVVALLAPAVGVGWLGLAALLLVTTHVMAGNRSSWLDRALLGPVGGRLIAIAESAARQPDALSALVEAQEGIAALASPTVLHEPEPRNAEDTADTPIDASSPPADEQLAVLVGRALRHLNDRSALGVHPLADALPALVVGAATPLERGERLQRALYDAVERLRPPGQRPTPGSPETRRWREYLVLSETYAQDRQNKETMRRWGMSEGTFNRARSAAIRGVAAELAARAADDAARLRRAG